MQVKLPPRCWACRAPITEKNGEDTGLCFECEERTDRSFQEWGGSVWLPCVGCHSVQVAASEGFNTCIECSGTA